MQLYIICDLKSPVVDLVGRPGRQEVPGVVSATLMDYPLRARTVRVSGVINFVNRKCKITYNPI